MNEIKDPIPLFEEWIENMRKTFNIVKFKEFREEMFAFAENAKNEKDIIKISEIVVKYMEKK